MLPAIALHPRSWRHHFKLGWLSGAGWLALTAGCVPSQSLSLVPDPSPPVITKSDDSDKDKHLPKRLPQAATCVAFGDFNLKAGSEKFRPALQREQLLDKARRSYQEAIKLNNNCKEAYLGLAQTYQEMGDHQREVNAYQSALKVFPKDASFWFELGMCQARAKEWDAAIVNLDAAVELDPENRTYANMQGYTLARAGRMDESLEAFKKLGGEAQAHYNLARMLHHMQQDELSKEHLLMALEAKPDLPGAREMLAQLENPSKTGSAATASLETTK
jgi:tetratricopeptide (TPR) repeat protein